MKKGKQYDAAISFAGEQRSLARSITQQLTPLGYNIFYDGYNIQETWGRDLSEVFQNIYSNTKCILIIVTEEYKAKAWTIMERRFAVENSLKNPATRLLQIKLEPVDIPGIPSVIGHYTYDGDLNKLCSAISSILGQRAAPELTGNSIVVKEILKACFRRAIFTSTESEISARKCFDSISACISKLHQILVDLNNGELSQFVKGIIKDLDAIDRFSRNKEHYLVSFPETDKRQIDSLKLNIIDKLHYLNYKFQTRIDIPTDIDLDYNLRQYYFGED